MFDLFGKSDTDDYEFIQSQIGTDVYINDSAISTRALVTNTNLEQNYDDKKISSLSPLNRGDIIVYEDNKYMLISEINGQRYNKFKGIMRKLPHYITVNSACNFIHLDCYITVGDLGVTSGKVITVSDGSITVYTRNNVNVKVGSRFIIDGQAFKVTGIDTFSQEGIFILSCDKDSIDTVKDDLVNGIAGGNVCTVDINNLDSNIFVDTTLQLVYSSTEGATVTFTSSDSAIATVNDIGLVTGITEGVVTITIKNATNDKIKDSITVTVENVPASFSVSITNTTSKPTELIKSISKTYQAVVYDGATIVIDQPVTWSIFADDQVNTTTYAVIVSQTDTSCVVKAGSTVGYVQLKASLVSDPSIIAWYRIKITSAI